jgi:hypothetical protein
MNWEVFGRKWLWAEVLCWHLHIGTEENHDKAVFQPRFKPSTSQICIKNVPAMPTIRSLTFVPLPWRWSQQVPPKYSYLYARLHDVTPQKAAIIIAVDSTFTISKLLSRDCSHFLIPLQCAGVTFRSYRASVCKVLHFMWSCNNQFSINGPRNCVNIPSAFNGMPLKLDVEV